MNINPLQASHAESESSDKEPAMTHIMAVISSVQELHPYNLKNAYSAVPFRSMQERDASRFICNATQPQMHSLVFSYHTAFSLGLITLKYPTYFPLANVQLVLSAFHSSDFRALKNSSRPATFVPYV